MLGTVLVVILFLVLIRALPRWWQNRSWTYYSRWWFCAHSSHRSHSPGCQQTLNMKDIAARSKTGAKLPRLVSLCFLAVLLVFMCTRGLSAYSVLTHEEIVELLWADEIRPLLLQRFP